MGAVYMFFIIVAVIFILFILNFIPVGLWISAYASNVKVSIFNLVGMRLRRVAPNKIIMPMIKAVKARIRNIY